MGKFVLTAELKLQAPGNINSVVNQINSRLKDIQINFKLQDAGKAVSGLNDVSKAADRATNSVDKMGYAFGVSLKRFAAFSIASRAIGLFSNRLAGAIDDAINFQDQMVRLSQITGETTKDLRYIADEIGGLATKFGVTSKAILSVTDILAQAGLQAKDLTVAINALAKTELAPTFGKIEDTAEGAVAILAQFGEGVGALERQLGSINRVAAQFAVESEDLISVIRRTGGVFKASGGSLEELLAVFTSVRATTRESAESIATGLRTIFTRIQRPETIQYLKQFGVELTDLNGKFVGPFDAVKKLSEALSQFGEGDIRFIAIAEELGGYRQIGKVIPLIRQFSLAEQARQVAVEGGASLDEDAAKSQESLRRQFIKTQESFLKLIRDIGDTTSFQTMIKVGLNLANAFIKVADSIKPIIPLIGALAAIKFAQGIGNFAAGVGAGFRQIVGPRTKNAGGKIHAFARGGLVPGSGNRDTVPAMLSPGEFVIRKSSVNKIGAGQLAAMNENRYAKGGFVRQYNNGTSGKGIAAPTDEEIALYKSLGSASGIKKFLPPGATKNNLLRNASTFNYGIFKNTLQKAQEAKEQAKLGRKAGEDPNSVISGAILNSRYGVSFLEGALSGDFGATINQVIKSGNATGVKILQEAINKDGRRLLPGAKIQSPNASVAFLTPQAKQIFDNEIVDGFPKLFDQATSKFNAPLRPGKVNINQLLSNSAIQAVKGYFFEAFARRISQNLITDSLQDKTDSIFDFTGAGNVSDLKRMFGGKFANPNEFKVKPTTENIANAISKAIAIRGIDALQLFANGGSVAKQKFAKGTSGKGIPLIDDILQNAPGSAILPVPSKAIQSIIDAGGAALDVDRTLIRTIGDTAYAKAKTPEAKQEVLARYFRDPAARMRDITTSPITQFGKELIGAVARGQIDPRSLSIISKSSAVPGIKRYIRGKFGIPESNMQFTSGGNKVPFLEKVGMAGPKIAKTKKFATGGPAPSDTVPALLTPGEFVINKSSAQRIGYGNLNKMNKQGVAGFASGGPVGFRFGGNVAKQNISDSFNREGTALVKSMSEVEGIFGQFLANIKTLPSAIKETVNNVQLFKLDKTQQFKTTTLGQRSGDQIRGISMGGKVGINIGKASQHTVRHEGAHEIDRALGGGQLASRTSGTFQNKVALELQKSLAAEGDQSAYRLDLGELWADAMAKAPPEVQNILASTTDAAKGSQLLAEYFEKAGGPVAGLADLSADEFGGIQDPKKRQAAKVQEVVRKNVAQAQENIKKSKANIQVQRTDIANQQKKISGVDTKIASQQSIQTQAKQRQAEINAAQTKLSGKMAPQGTDPAQFTDAQKKAVERFNILQKAYDEQQKILNNSEKAIKGLDASRKKYQAKIDSATKTIKEERENIRANSQNIQAYRDVTGKPSAKSERQAGTSLRQRVPMSPSGPGGGGRPPINPPVPPSGGGPGGGGPGGGGPGGGSGGPSEKDANASFVKFAAFTGAINTVGTSLIEMGKNADGTSTAFSRIAEASLGVVNQVSAVIFALQQFGVSLNIKGLKQFFGSGPGSLGDKLTGNRLANFVGPMQPKGPGLISRGFSSAKQGVVGSFGAIKSGLSSGYAATKQAVTNPLATIKSGYTAAQEKVSNIKDSIGNFPTSVRKRARSFLGTEKMKGSFENFIENTSGKISSGIKNAPGRIGGFIKSAPSNITSGVGKAIGGIKGAGANIGSNVLGVISKVAGPLAAIGGSAVLVSGAFNSVISAAYDYENQIKAAVEAGNAEKAAELAGKQSDLQAANTLRTVGAGAGAVLGAALGPVGSFIGAIAGAAIATGLAAAFPEFAQGVSEFFGGDTKKSVMERARADGLAAKYTLEHAANLKEADAATQQWQAGLISTEQAMMVWGRNARNAAAAFSAEQSAVAESQANKSTGFQANLRDVFSLGGTLFEGSTARNTRIDKENAARSKESFKGLSTEFEGLMSGPLAKNLFATGKSGQEVMDAMAKMNPEIFAAMNQAANSSDEALSKMGKQALETAKRNAEASAKQAENQKKYLETLNLGLFNVVSGAQAAASALELIAMQGEGVDPLTKSMKVLEAAVTSQAGAMDPKQIETATQEYANSLRQSGLAESDVQKNVSALQATTQVQAGLGTSLDAARSKLQKSAAGGNPEEIRNALVEAATANITDEQQRATVSARLKNINLDDPKIMAQLVGGDVSGILKAASEQLTEATKEQIEAGNLLAKNNQALSAMVMKRIEAEKQAADAANEAVDVGLEMAKVREQFGGPKVTIAQQRQASAQRTANILRGTGISGGAGTPQDLSRAGQQIQQELLALERKKAAGAFTDVDKQRETQLLQASAGVTDQKKKELELAKESAEVTKRKVSMEKSAFEKLLGGDVMGAIEDMMATSAAAALRSGDAGLAGAFGGKALLGGLKNLEETGASAEQKQVAARAAGASFGIGPRLADAFAGTTREEMAANQQVAAATYAIEQGAKESADLAQARTDTAVAFEEQARAAVKRPPGTPISFGGTVPLSAPEKTTAGAPVVAPGALGGATAGGAGSTSQRTGGATGTATGAPTIGAGISPEVIASFGTSVSNFVAAVDKLQNLKLSVQIDATNVNVNLNGGTFLNTLSTEVRNTVLDAVAQEIPKYKVGPDGKLTKGGIVG